MKATKSKAPGHTVRLSTKGQMEILPPTRIEDLIGCTGYRGPAKSLKEMDQGIAKGARRSR
jgi:hypothetical protein